MSIIAVHGPSTWGAGTPTEPDPIDPDPIDVNPTTGWTKAQILAWLSERGIDITLKAVTDLTKAELLSLVEDVLNDDVDSALMVQPEEAS